MMTIKVKKPKVKSRKLKIPSFKGIGKKIRFAKAKRY